MSKHTYLLAMILLPALAVGQDVRQCPAGAATVATTGDRSETLVCKAVTEAVTQLAKCDIVPKEPLRVRVVRELPPECPEHALAYFDASTQVVTIPTYVDCVRLAGPGGRFGMPMTLPLYRSLIVHELAHAVIAQVGDEGLLGRVEHEYLAYATQFAVMESSLRSLILAGHPVTQPVRQAELSEVYFGLSPARFAVKAYLHFIAPGNGCGFAHQLIEGTRKLPSGMR